MSSPTDTARTEVPPQREDVEDVPRDLLFKLPLELRDLVYSLCFEQGCYKLFQHGMQCNVHLGRPGGGPFNLRLPDWLLTCKQVLAEAMAQFSRDVVCAYVSVALEEQPPNTNLLQLHRLKDVRVECSVQVDTFTGDRYGDHEVAMSFSDAQSTFYHLLSHGCNVPRLSVWFDIGNALYAAQFSDAKVPTITTSFPLSPKGASPLEKLLFVIEEPDYLYYGLGPDRMAKNGEIVYSLAQKQLTDLAINMISTPGASNINIVMRDWLQKEDFMVGEKSKTRYNWHLEVSLANIGTGQAGELKYGGMQNFRYQDAFDDDDYYFGDRKEGPDGLVTWQSSDGRLKQMRRPVWLDGLVRRTTDAEDEATEVGDEEEDAATEVGDEDEA